MRAVSIALVAAVAACGPADDGGGGDVDGAAPAPDARPGGDGGDPPSGCAALPVTIRDFRITHPDFETFESDAVITGLVEPTLGADRTPVYAHAGPTVCTSGPAAFADWYHDVPGVNLTLPRTLELIETAPGVYVYDSAAFFPIDGDGFGAEGLSHNYSFTTEIHTSFRYTGGERFTFRGDDDMWLFVNDRLAIDLGGTHQPADATVDLDAQAAALGITPGNTYRMDIFHAERHTDESNFRIETTIDCFVVP